jgi:hypothetical protein
MIAQILPPSALYDKSRGRIVVKMVCSRQSGVTKSSTRTVSLRVQADHYRAQPDHIFDYVVDILAHAVRQSRQTRLASSSNGINGESREGKRSSLYSPSWGEDWSKAALLGIPHPTFAATFRRGGIAYVQDRNLHVFVEGEG